MNSFEHTVIYATLEVTMVPQFYDAELHHGRNARRLPYMMNESLASCSIKCDQSLFVTFGLQQCMVPERYRLPNQTVFLQHMEAMRRNIGLGTKDREVDIVMKPASYF
jgi:hypothetical protein